jgi:DNA repair protein RadC
MEGGDGVVNRIAEMDPSQRPRERLLDYGPSVLSDAELIAVLLRTGRRGQGVVDSAQRLLADEGGLTGVARMDIRQLVARPGFGPAKAATLLAALELGTRLARSELHRRERLDSPDVAAEYLRRRLQTERRELFGFLTLDARRRLLRCHELTRGTRSQATVDPAEVFRNALLDDASGVLVFHNHPSGDLDPSRDDLDLTRRLARGGEVVGIRLLDHLVVAGSRWLSLRSARPDLFVV